MSGMGVSVFLSLLPVRRKSSTYVSGTLHNYHRALPKWAALGGANFGKRLKINDNSGQNILGRSVTAHGGRRKRGIKLARLKHFHNHFKSRREGRGTLPQCHY
jgi:hypothetical protein